MARSIIELKTKNKEGLSYSTLFEHGSSEAHPEDVSVFTSLSLLLSFYAGKPHFSLFTLGSLCYQHAAIDVQSAPRGQLPVFPHRQTARKVEGNEAGNGGYYYPQT